MVSHLDEEENETPEITLSTASLLGIFFGLVLICGVFFGFGYSMGRGSGTAGSAPPASAVEADQTVTTESPKSVALTPTEPERAPSPAVVVKRNDPPAEDTPAVLRKPSAAPASVASAPLPATPAVSVSENGPRPMVQIAAVARQEDADALVSALKQRGYGVVVRNEPQDKLLHVQVGPFADRTQAGAMKQKLLSDGYNAIVKQ